FGWRCFASQSRSVLSYSPTGMPLLATPSSSRIGFGPNFASASRSCAARALNTGSSFHSGCCDAAAFSWSGMTRNWKYSGSQPPALAWLSNTAMRSPGATSSLLFRSVTAWTNATIADFASPSFQDGSIVCADAAETRRKQKRAIPLKSFTLTLRSASADEISVVAVVAVAPQHAGERPRPLLSLARVRAETGPVELEQALALLGHGRAESFVGADERRGGVQREHPGEDALEFPAPQPRRVLDPRPIVGHRQRVRGVAFQTGPARDPGGEERGRR